MRDDNKQDLLKGSLRNVTELANTRPPPRPYQGPSD